VSLWGGRRSWHWSVARCAVPAAAAAAAAATNDTDAGKIPASFRRRPERQPAVGDSLHFIADCRRVRGSCRSTSTPSKPRLRARRCCASYLSAGAGGSYMARLPAGRGTLPPAHSISSGAWYCPTVRHPRGRAVSRVPCDGGGGRTRPCGSPRARGASPSERYFCVCFRSLRDGGFTRLDGSPVRPAVSALPPDGRQSHENDSLCVSGGDRSGRSCLPPRLFAPSPWP
jgi:hypothetical protein